jgi:hypothetical protein
VSAISSKELITDGSGFIMANIVVYFAYNSDQVEVFVVGADGGVAG